MRSIASVDVALADLAQKTVVANLLQLCLHDYSGVAPQDAGPRDIAADGRFPYQWLDHYWREPRRFPFIIHADGSLVGFALVNEWSALDQPLDHAMAEFFVLRKYRRSGIGQQAAGLIFRRLGGRWEVPVAGYNAPALTFWRATVGAALTHGVTEAMGDGQRWSGPVLCFNMPAPDPAA